MNQTFSINLGGKIYNLLFKWNNRAVCWILDISDSLNNLMVAGIPLVTGINLLQQYEYLGFPGGFFVQTDNDPNAVPTFSNFGSTGHLYWVQPK